MAYPRFQLGRTFKIQKRTAGNVTPTANTTTWANFDTAMDIVLAGQVGDVIEVGLNGLVSAANGEINLDVATIVAAAPVNTFSLATAEATGGSGIMGWYKSDAILSQLGPAFFYTLVAGDISGGMVTLRLRMRSGTSTAKTVYANSTQAFLFYAKNLGPVDPH